jgi:hypothetical protein
MNDFGSETQLTSTLDRWKNWGIAGIKIDFFDGQGANTTVHTGYGEHQMLLQHYERVYQECAKRQMVINCHGCNKPTGERRIYPHVINREAVRGNEMVNNISEFLTTIPFIRGTIGPTDYTPTLLPMNENVTVGHQLALHILLETGSISMGDKIEVYQEIIAKDFLKFCHTETALQTFTSYTGVTRPFEYQITQEQYDSLTYYSKSLYDTYKMDNVDLVYDLPLCDTLITNAKYFQSYWKWSTNISGSVYDNPFLDFINDTELSSLDYFKGLEDYHKTSWSTNVK